MQNYQPAHPTSSSKQSSISLWLCVQTTLPHGQGSFSQGATVAASFRGNIPKCVQGSDRLSKFTAFLTDSGLKRNIARGQDQSWKQQPARMLIREDGPSSKESQNTLSTAPTQEEESEDRIGPQPMLVLVASLPRGGNSSHFFRPTGSTGRSFTRCCETRDNANLPLAVCCQQLLQVWIKQHAMQTLQPLRPPNL